MIFILRSLKPKLSFQGDGCRIKINYCAGYAEIAHMKGSALRIR